MVVVVVVVTTVVRVAGAKENWPRELPEALGPNPVFSGSSIPRCRCCEEGEEKEGSDGGLRDPEDASLAPGRGSTPATWIDMGASEGMVHSKPDTERSIGADEEKKGGGKESAAWCIYWVG